MSESESTIILCHTHTQSAMKTLIGIVGRKRSGKDTVAGFIRDMSPDARILSFAGPLKQACKHAYHLTDEQLEGTKDSIDPRWGVTPRDMMKHLGVNYFREQDPEQWTKNMGFRMDGLESVVISDVRFPNEAAFVREKGGVLIHVSRDVESNCDDHVSERMTDEISCQHFIRNDGSLDDLRAEVKMVLC